jgi:hypothetical protein
VEASRSGDERQIASLWRQIGRLAQALKTYPKPPNAGEARQIHDTAAPPAIWQQHANKAEFRRPAVHRLKQLIGHHAGFTGGLQR